MNNTLSILNTITSLGKTLKVDIEFRPKDYYSNDTFVWRVSLQHVDGAVRVTCEGDSPRFEEALEQAWVKLMDVAYHGIGEAAVNPVALPAPKHLKEPFNDEVPF